MTYPAHPARVAISAGSFRQLSEQKLLPAAAINWIIFDNGNWSAPPEQTEIAVLVGDAYCSAFKDAVLTAPNLRWVHTENTGTDGEFYEKILSREVLLTNSPGANAPEVAEFVLGLMLWSVKRLGSFQANQSRCRWERVSLETLGNKTILVVGLGQIGGRVVRLAKAFGMYTLGISKKTAGAEAELDEHGTLRSLAVFLPRADIVVLALPLTAETKNLIGNAELAAMKERVVLINVARGELIDLAALKKTLKDRPAMQVCLDVLPREPLPADDGLWCFENLFITPHIAWSSPLFRSRAMAQWLVNLARYQQDLPLVNLVTP